MNGSFSKCLLQVEGAIETSEVPIRLWLPREVAAVYCQCSAPPPSTSINIDIFYCTYIQLAWNVPCSFSQGVYSGGAVLEKICSCKHCRRGEFRFDDAEKWRRGCYELSKWSEAPLDASRGDQSCITATEHTLITLRSLQFKGAWKLNSNRFRSK